MSVADETNIVIATAVTCGVGIGWVVLVVVEKVGEVGYASAIERVSVGVSKGLHNNGCGDGNCCACGSS